MPRRCSICARKDVKKVNEAICNNLSYRSIAQRFGVIHTTLQRHIETCLGLELATIQQKHREQQAIDVYEEFKEQLAFAKDLRVAAREYLSDVADPLRLSITPKAHEIEVTYFDHNDMEMVGEVMRPKKKTAQLSTILESIFAEGNLEPDKYKITTIDIRKFALDAINTTDTCIDKFAKLSGEYTKEKDNPQRLAEVVYTVSEQYRIAYEFDKIHKESNGRWGKPMLENFLDIEIERYAKHHQQDPDKVRQSVQADIAQLGVVG